MVGFKEYSVFLTKVVGFKEYSVFLTKVVGSKEYSILGRCSCIPNNTQRLSRSGYEPKQHLRVELGVATSLKNIHLYITTLVCLVKLNLLIENWR